MPFRDLYPRYAERLGRISAVPEIIKHELLIRVVWRIDHAARFLFESEPKRAVALVDRDPDMKTDRLASVLLDFGGGRQASFVCSTQSVNHQSLELIGTKGRVELIIPFNAPPDTATAILVDAGLSPDGHLSRREIIAPCDQYTEQANAFCRAVLDKTPLPWGVEDAISSMKVLDAIFASEKSGAWATV